MRRNVHRCRGITSADSQLIFRDDPLFLDIQHRLDGINKAYQFFSTQSVKRSGGILKSAYQYA